MKPIILKQRNILLIISGFLSLAIVMGIGRFSYTPILPYMELNFLLTPFTAGLLATINFIGYFIGAIGARFIPQQSSWLLRGLLINIGTTFLMGFSESYLFWLILRFLSGVTSGLIFVLVSNLILSHLNRTGKMYYSGFLFGGVGFGILISGLTIPTIESYFSWHVNWIFLGIVSVIFMFFIIYGMNLQEPTNYKSPPPTNKPIDPISYTQTTKYALYISYTLEGFGYIIFGTFITAMLVNNPNFTFESSYVWAVVGLGAIPSCIFWAWLGKKISDISALKWAYITQIVSILIPVFTDNLILVLIAAFGFGATFMGITTLTMTIAKSLYGQSGNLISGLTASYAAGQLLGPVVAGSVIIINSYIYPFIISAVALITALITINTINVKEGEMIDALRKHQSN
ncbi:YbfB/YjiJ family MFS transporter [Halalkalibacterium ligniniphilum]|uniref:YbfB/YjiJ family MFS transporter n=1 Tax=Halalkalibacterium ligniniphilum TaxID=1134413 RepID=UPI000345B00E|nr:YbfB/YjiJ family MFS transporter [Halalkalibacterium ligniniphilum]